MPEIQELKNQIAVLKRVGFIDGQPKKLAVSSLLDQMNIHLMNENLRQLEEEKSKHLLTPTEQISSDLDVLTNINMFSNYPSRYITEELIVELENKRKQLETTDLLDPHANAKKLTERWKTAGRSDNDDLRQVANYVEHLKQEIEKLKKGRESQLSEPVKPLPDDTTFTPGPWAFRRYPNFEYTVFTTHPDYAERSIVDTVGCEPQDEVNAKLIAAAPAMHDVLLEITTAADSNPSANTVLSREYRQAINNARKVLANAIEFKCVWKRAPKDVYFAFHILFGARVIKSTTGNWCVSVWSVLMLANDYLCLDYGDFETLDEAKSYVEQLMRSNTSNSGNKPEHEHIFDDFF